jgi:hypothetical protein
MLPIIPTNVDDIIKQLSPTRRKKVEARAAELIAEEMSLREPRHGIERAAPQSQKKRSDRAM